MAKRRVKRKSNVLTKRDKIAIATFQALLTAHYSTPETEHSADDSVIAELAVQQADLLVAALKAR